jgi:hypothetical protein
LPAIIDEIILGVNRNDKEWAGWSLLRKGEKAPHLDEASQRWVWRCAQDGDDDPGVLPAWWYENYLTCCNGDTSGHPTRSEAYAVAARCWARRD